VAVTQQRYDSVAIILHWVMAIAFFLMLGSGVTMEYFPIAKSLKFNMFQWHKSLGLLLLVAFVLRLGWRLFHKPPELPPSITGWEAVAAKAGHWALYLAIITMIMSGWTMVSASVYGLPTIIFGWFQWPHIPNIAGNEAVEHFAKTTHFYMAITFALLIAGHIGAVILHWFVQRENILTRMWWTKENR
jgi:cytochrome b561